MGKEKRGFGIGKKSAATFDSLGFFQTVIREPFCGELVEKFGNRPLKMEGEKKMEREKSRGYEGNRQRIRYYRKNGARPTKFLLASRELRGLFICKVDGAFFSSIIAGKMVEKLVSDPLSCCSQMTALQPPPTGACLCDGEKRENRW